MTKKKYTPLCWIVVMLTMLNLPLTAQQDSFKTPYAVVYNHLANLQIEQYDPAQSAKSFPETMDSAKAVQAAKRMKQIYDGRALYVHVERMPKDPNFRDSTAQDYVYFPYPEKLPDVYLERSNGQWHYSQSTVRQIPALFKQTYPYRLHKLVEAVPDEGARKIFGVYFWQIAGLLIICILGLIVYFILSRLLNFVIKKSLWRFGIMTEEQNRLLQKSDGFLALAAVTFIIIRLVPVLRMPIGLSKFLQDTGRIAFAIFIMLFLLRMVDFVIIYLRQMTEKTESRLDDQLLPILTKFVKIGIVIISIFRIMAILDINVTALIAGLSIGGLALALAAQDTVKNLIGSMMIFFDKPFQIGDYVTDGTIEGSVVEVGFRSSRIRKPDTSIITIPNANLSNSALTNLGVRNMRLFMPTLNIIYGTPVDKIQEFLDRLRAFAKEHPRVHPEDQYIHLTNLGASSIDILFRVYIETMVFAEDFQLKEELVFGILRIAEEIGVQFAFPSTSVYIEQDGKS